MPEHPIYTEEELFREVAEGNEIAFRQLFITYTGVLYPFILNMVNSEVWAEDIIQNIFTKIWTGRQQLQRLANPAGYLYRMASNSALDYMKHHAVELKAQYHISRQYTNANRNFTEEQFDYKIYEQLLKQAVQQMPPQRRLVFQLKQESGLSNDEIAERLQISKNTVRVHVAEALQSIRKYLQEKGDLLLVFFFAAAFFSK